MFIKSTRVSHNAYSPNVAPPPNAERKSRISYILSGGVLAACMLVGGVVLFRTRIAENKNGQLLIVSLVALGLMSVLAAFLALIIILWRTKRQRQSQEEQALASGAYR